MSEEERASLFPFLPPSEITRLSSAYYSNAPFASVPHGYVVPGFFPPGYAPFASVPHGSVVPGFFSPGYAPFASVPRGSVVPGFFPPGYALAGQVVVPVLPCEALEPLGYVEALFDQGVATAELDDFAGHNEALAQVVVPLLPCGAQGDVEALAGQGAVADSTDNFKAVSRKRKLADGTPAPIQRTHPIQFCSV